VTAVLGVAAPLVSVPVVLIGGLMTPGYDPAQLTVSRLAEPGLPAALPIGLAIFAVGLALIGLAGAFGPRAVAGRTLLAIAGASLVVAALLPINSASEQASTAHRFATTVAMLALVAAPLAFAPSLRRRHGWHGYGRLSFGVGVADVGVLLLGFALLPTTFAVGAWERCLLAMPLAWTVLISARLLHSASTEPTLASATENISSPTAVSAQDRMNAPAASVSSSLS
jgi:hypothetical protein